MLRRYGVRAVAHRAEFMAADDIINPQRAYG